MFPDDLTSKDVVEAWRRYRLRLVSFEPERKHGSFAAKVLGKR
jgi:hypothetical protein